MRRFSTLFLSLCLMAAAGCATPEPTGTDEQTDPTAPAGTRVTVTSDGPGYRLESTNGNLMWVDSDRLLVGAQVPDNEEEQSTFLVNLADQTATHVLTAPAQRWVIPQGSGQAILTSGWKVLFVDGATGKAETILAGDGTSPQWTATENLAPDTGSLTHVTWVSREAIILTLEKGEQELTPWGKLLLVDTVNKEVTPLAAEGQVVAVLPDGRFLFREGWVEGPVKLIDGGGSTTVVEGGTWSWGFQLSPDNTAVAWFELNTPPGDGAKRLPQASGGATHSAVKGVAIWQAETGKVVRYPVTGASWPQDVAWQKDGSALHYYGQTKSQGQETTVSYQVSLNDGQVKQVGQSATGAGAPDRVVNEGLPAKILATYSPGRRWTVRWGGEHEPGVIYIQPAS